MSKSDKQTWYKSRRVRLGFLNILRARFENSKIDLRIFIKKLGKGSKQNGTGNFFNGNQATIQIFSFCFLKKLLFFDEIIHRNNLKNGI
jgi:hypothetical protein